MCQVCNEINKKSVTGLLNEVDQRSYLVVISELIEQGQPPKHFQKALDMLLETCPTAVDKDLEAAWEASRNRTD